MCVYLEKASLIHQVTIRAFFIQRIEDKAIFWTKLLIELTLKCNLFFFCSFVQKKFKTNLLIRLNVKLFYLDPK